METRLSLAPGQNGTKKLLARYGERLVCVRYRYDRARKVRHKTVELIVETTAWEPNRRNPRREPEDMVAVRIAFSERRCCGSGSRRPAPFGARGKGCGKWTGRRCAISGYRIAWSSQTLPETDMWADIQAHMRISISGSLHMPIYVSGILAMPPITS